MSLRNDKAVDLVRKAAENRKKNNRQVFSHTPIPTKTQTLITIMAISDVMNVPMIDLIDKLLNQGAE